MKFFLAISAFVASVSAIELKPATVSLAQRMALDNKQAPKWEVDKEGYEADWGTEHRSEPYPAHVVGKREHAPGYKKQFYNPGQDHKGYDPIHAPSSIGGHDGHASFLPGSIFGINTDVVLGFIIIILLFVCAYFGYKTYSGRSTA